MLLRQVREQLAGWETGLIETARDAGASWTDLAPPFGVASRQAAERRYLRGRPGPGTTGEQRGLAGQITALTDLPAAARRSLSELHAALAHDDPADLIVPLTAARPTWSPPTQISPPGSTPSPPRSASQRPSRPQATPGLGSSGCRPDRTGPRRPCGFPPRAECGGSAA